MEFVVTKETWLRTPWSASLIYVIMAKAMLEALARKGLSTVAIPKSFMITDMAIGFGLKLSHRHDHGLSLAVVVEFVGN